MTKQPHESIQTIFFKSWWAIPLLVVTAAYWTSHSFGFVSDAVFLIEENAYLEHWGALWANLTGDYFYSSSGNTIPYWRPWTKASWLIEKQIFGDWAGGYHLVSVGWLLVGVGGVMALTRVLGGNRLWSSMAGLLFGLHCAVIEPTCLIMARSDVVSASCVILAIVSWIRWREDKERHWLFTHLLFLVLGVGSKESAVILIPLLTLWEIFVSAHGNASGDQAQGKLDWRKSMKYLAPVWIVGTTMLLLRARVLAGYDSPEMTLDPIRILTGGARYVEALLPFQFESGIRNITYLEARESGWRTGAVLLPLLATVFLLWRHGLKKHLMLLVWIGGSLAPVLLVQQMNVPNVEGKFPMADRWLLQGVAGSAVFWSLLAQRISLSWVQRALVASVCIWSLGAVVISSVTHGFYADEEGLISLEDENYLAIPEPYRTQEDICRFQEREVIRLQDEGKTSEVLKRLREMEERCGQSTPRAVQTLIVLVQSQEYQKAVSLGAELVTHMESEERKDTRLLPRVYYSYAYALANTGGVEKGLHYAQQAREQGFRECGVFQTIARAAEQSRKWSVSARSAELAFQCELETTGNTNPNLLKNAVLLWRKSGDTANEARVIKQLKAVTTP